MSTKTEQDRISVVWGLPSRLIGRIGSVPPYVELDVMSTGWALLRRLRGQPCDLLLIHSELPDTAGSALAARVRLLHSELPIVLTTDGPDPPEPGLDLTSLQVIGPLQVAVHWPDLLGALAGRRAARDAEALNGSLKVCH